MTNRATNRATNGACTIAVIGNGIAALCARAALRKAGRKAGRKDGFRVLAITGEEPASCSLPPRVVICPRLRRDDDCASLFILESFLASCSPALRQTAPDSSTLSLSVPFYLSQPWSRSIVARGAIRLAQNSHEQQRLRGLAVEHPQLCSWLDTELRLGSASGLTSATTAWGGNFYPDALVLDPQKLFACESASCEHDSSAESASEQRIVRAELTAIERVGYGFADGSQHGHEGYRLFTRAGEISTPPVRAIVLAVGSSLPSLLSTLCAAEKSFLQPLLQTFLNGLRVARGRLDHCARAELSHPPLLAVCASGWVTPWIEDSTDDSGEGGGERVGVVRGLSARREGFALAENRKRLASWCQDGNNQEGNEKELSFGKAYIGERLSTSDRLPLLGKIDAQAGGNSLFAGLYLFGALAGHGYLVAPLCAEILAQTIAQDLTQDLAASTGSQPAPEAEPEHHSDYRNLLAVSRYLSPK